MGYWTSGVGHNEKTQDKFKNSKSWVDPDDGVSRVVAWDNKTNSPCVAYACQVEESGDGTALLIYGGSGGIRMKPLEDETEWKLGVPNQKGETHLVYPLDCFVIYKDEI